MKRQKSAMSVPPNHVSVTADDTMMNSLISHSGSSSKKPKRSPELVVLMGDSEGEDNYKDAAKSPKDYHLLGQSSFESPIPQPAPMNRKHNPVEQQLNATFLAVLQKYQSKYPNMSDNNGYGMDYP